MQNCSLFDVGRGMGVSVRAIGAFRRSWWVFLFRKFWCLGFKNQNQTIILGPFWKVLETEEC